MYRIVFKYYSSVKQLEAGQFYSIVDSGFTPCTLGEANTLKSKLNNTHKRIIQIERVV